jgi:hypothetical protein
VEDMWMSQTLEGISRISTIQVFFFCAQELPKESYHQKGGLKSDSQIATIGQM